MGAKSKGVMGSVMRHTSRWLAPAVCLFMFSQAQQAGAAVLVGYGFGTDSATATLSPTTTSSDVTGLPITAGNGWTLASSGSDTYGISTSSGNPINALFTRGTTDATEQDAYDNARYFSLTLEPDSGSQVSLSSLTFDYYKDSLTSNTAFFLRTDAGGSNFSTTIASGNLTGSSTSGWQSVTVDLSSVASLQDMTQAATFHIYFYGAATDTRITRYDNLAFDGTVVPEPTTAGVLCLAGMGLTLVRRRRG